MNWGTTVSYQMPTVRNASGDLYRESTEQVKIDAVGDPIWTEIFPPPGYSTEVYSAPDGFSIEKGIQVQGDWRLWREMVPMMSVNMDAAGNLYHGSERSMQAMWAPAQSTGHTVWRLEGVHDVRTIGYRVCMHRACVP